MDIKNPPSSSHTQIKQFSRWALATLLLLISVNGFSNGVWTITKAELPFTDIAWSPSLSLYAAISNSGQSSIISTSRDGENWNTRWNLNVSIILEPDTYVPYEKGIKFKSIHWLDDQFFAIGDNGIILSSTDGLQWNYRNIGYDIDLNDIIWNGDIFIAVGERTILKSDDALHWEMLPILLSEIQSVAWSGDLFVAVTVSGLYLKSDTGISWTRHMFSEGTGFTKIIWANDQFIAISRTSILRSVDGRRWHIEYQNEFSTFSDITWNGSQFLAVGYNRDLRGTELVSSLDGISWQGGNLAPNANQSNTNLVWANDRYLLGGNSRLLYSSNGIDWETQTNFPILPSSSSIAHGIAHYANGWVVVSTNGIVAISPDATTWHRIFENPEIHFRAVVATPSQIVVVGDEGQIWTRINGQPWARQNSGSEENLLDVLWDGATFFVVGKNGLLLKSSDAKTWQKISLPTTNALSQIAWSGSEYLITSGDLIYRSTNGIDWQEITSPEFDFTYSITWNNTQFLAGGTNKIFRSTDGVMWELHAELPFVDSERHDIYSVSHIKNQTVILGIRTDFFTFLGPPMTHEFIYTSTDLKTWSLPGVNGNSLATHGQKTVLVGYKSISVHQSTSRFNHESPVHNANASGINVVRGWVCDAETVEFQIDDNMPKLIPYGHNRADTAGICGDTNNGYAQIVNWSQVGDGQHDFRIYIDGDIMESIRFTVTTLGVNFLTGISKQVSVEDFPESGDITQLTWSEKAQNFIISGFQATAATSLQTDLLNSKTVLENAAKAIIANHESPANGSLVSGIGIIRGWVCDADTLSYQIDDGNIHPLLFGQSRNDTADICGDINNGYAQVVNWANLGDGEHTLRILIDGKEYTTSTFTVTTLGTTFLRDAKGSHDIEDFPSTGDLTTLSWSEKDQNFIISSFYQP